MSKTPTKPPKKSANKSPTKRLVLLDAHAIIHRAYHALPEFTSSKGEPTGALYGLSTMLMKIITDLKPDYVVACYDLPQKTFRHESYEGYKAGRKKADEGLSVQIESSRRIFDAFNIPIYDAPGFEADDVLGTIVSQVTDPVKCQSLNVKCPLDIVIASGDMDTLQLIDDKRVQVYTLKKGINDTIMYDEDAVRARFGFDPEFLPDYKGLRGDASDNIIGIKGIGEKTAGILIQEFGTIENIYKTLKKDQQKVLKTGVSPRITLLLSEGEEEALFSKTLATIRRDAPIKFELPPKELREGIEIKKIEDLFLELEFKSLRERARSMFSGVSSVSSAQPAVEAKEEEKVPDIELRKWGIALSLLNSEMTSPLPEDIIHFDGAKNFAEAKENLLAKIKENNLTYVYEDIEMAIFPLVLEMEKFGVKVDVEYLKKLSVDYHAELEKLEKNIWKLAGVEFNINSPKQLGDVLFDGLKLVPGGTARMKKTAGGARSTRESELAKLLGIHPIIDEIFKHRELQKLLSTYIDTLPYLVDENNRIHARFNQIGAATGRFSSQDPNLQNIPIKSELGKNIRNAFVAAPGHKLVSFDYSQIELRIAALLSGDEYLTRVFTEGKDPHAAVAAKVFGVTESDVTSEMRRKAKVINFGILYGMGVTALQQNLGTNRKEAQEFYDNYFLQFPAISGYLNNEIENARRLGFTETLFGRRRYFPGIKSPLGFIKAMNERMAINAPIQGTQADCIKLAIYEADKALEKAGLKSGVHLILQVHDELVYEIDGSLVDKASELIEDIMKNIIPEQFLKGKKNVPLEVHVAVGNNWGELGMGPKRKTI